MKKLNALTGLRGVAAYSLLVAHAIHYSFIYPGHQLLSDLTFGLGHFGMSLTFVLSGFVIHYNYSNIIRSEGIVSGGYRFMTARVAKLYPLYIFGIVMSLGSLPSNNFDNLWQAISDITLTQTWFNIEGINGVLFGHSWPISAEWFFYITFILFSGSVTRIRNSFRALIIFLIVTPIILAIIFSLKDPVINILTPFLALKGMPISAPIWHWLTYFSPYIRVLEFIAGALASQLYLAGAHKPLSSFAVNIYTLACVIWCFIGIGLNAFPSNFFANFLPNFIFAPAIAPLLILLCRYHTSLSNFLSKRYMMFFGEISYSVWVFQFAVMSIFLSSFVLSNSTWLSPMNAIIKTILIVILATVFGYGSYLMLEIPAQRWLKSKLLAKKPQYENTPEVVLETVRSPL